MNDIYRHTNSVFLSCTYRVGNVIIDPGDYWSGFGNVDHVLLTHAHFDHIYGLNTLLFMNPNIRVYTNSFGAEMLIDSKKNMSMYHETPFVFRYLESICLVEDGTELRVGDLVAKAIFTPGHNPSCITWVMDDCVFSGDSLIPGVKTVTNLPKGDKVASIESEKIIMKLAIGRQLYPGHKI